MRTLRHGMAGAPGLEIWGPYEQHGKIRDAILEAGREFGIEPCGSRAYSSNTLESGWIPSPLPAIYSERRGAPTGSGCRADSYEAINALAGSFVSDDIEDYYLNPWELGYGSFVKFDHDFIGRERWRRSTRRTQRKKVTLAWNDEDLAKILGRVRSTATGPATSSSTCPTRTTARRTTTRSWTPTAHGSGLSLFTGYGANERRGLSLATVDPDVPIGAEVTVIWGEPDGGTRKTTVEPHEQLASARSSAPLRTPRWPARLTIRAGDRPWRLSHDGHSR